MAQVDRPILREEVMKNTREKLESVFGKNR